MSHNTDGIQMHVTTKGKLVFVAQNNGESVTFQVDLNTAKEFRNNLNSTISQLENDALVEA